MLIRRTLHVEKDVEPGAFLSHRELALHMARFPEAERRRQHKMICMRCRFMLSECRA